MSLISLKVVFSLPAVTLPGPHKDSLCAMTHLQDGSLVSCSQVGYIREKERGTQREGGRQGGQESTQLFPECAHTFSCINIGWGSLFLDT